MWACWSRGGGGVNRLTRPTSLCADPGEWEVAVSVPPGNCRSSVLGAVIFLSTTSLMTEPRGLITPPPTTSATLLPAPRSSFPLVLPRCLSEGCLLCDWCSSPHKAPHPFCHASSPWPRAQPFILKWRRPALHQPGPSACSLLYCLASEKDYYFNSIYCE